MQRRPQPLGQTEHLLPGFCVARGHVNPCLKRRLTDGFHLVTRKLLRARGPKHGVPAAPLIDRDFAAVTKIVNFHELIEDAHRPPEKLSDLLISKRAQLVRIVVRHHCLHSHVGRPSAFCVVSLGGQPPEPLHARSVPSGPRSKGLPLPGRTRVANYAVQSMTNLLCGAGGIRTHTGKLLRLVPLPLGYGPVFLPSLPPNVDVRE
jgi:hypothetical protein